MKNYLILFALLLSVSYAADHRFEIDEKERALVVKNILDGNLELMGDANVQLYGVSDFYLLLDRVLDYPKKDESRKLADVAKIFDEGSRVNPNEKFLDKRSEYFVSMNLIRHIDNKKDAESAKELITFFDALIEMSSHEDVVLSENAHKILISYSPYVKEKLDSKWFQSSFYTQTEAGKLLAKYR